LNAPTPPDAAHAPARQPHVVCRVGDLSPGQRLIVEVNGRSLGVFNIAGQFYALHNRCPHAGGALCQGPLTGTTLPTTEREFIYGREGQILRCAWHGWEFEVATGRCLSDPKLKARTYPVSVVDGAVVVHI
jgi:nitrite reductase (NADH) small subunit